MAFNRMVEDYKAEVWSATKKYDELRNLDLFVLDNSLRESTVGALRGHTVENKNRIFLEAKECGFKNHIVGSFSNMTRVDDVFVQRLINRGEDPSTLWAFTEVTAKIINKVPDKTNVPLGLSKIKKFGMWNAIIEIDLGDMIYDFTKFSVAEMCEMIRYWIKWCRANLHEESKVIVNIRDLPDFMPTHPERLFELVDYLSKLPDDLKLFAINFEEPRGLSVPEECGVWTRYIRRIMRANDWNGHILVHVHERYGYADATQLEILMNGGTGIWASVCIEGAFVGHASITVTLLNMIRLGNTKVLERYNCEYLRTAAINVTKCTTGLPPFPKQVIYGARAMDYVFDLRTDKFDLATFFGERAPMRMSSLASEEMIVSRLKYVFGNDPQFTKELATRMKEVMLEDLRGNRKEEYMSKCGLAILFDRSGGSLTEQMQEVITKDKIISAHANQLIAEIRAVWEDFNFNAFDTEIDTETDTETDFDIMQYDTFYHSFMEPYFSCYRCVDTIAGLQAIDMDKDNYVDWKEFKVYLMWAMREYPNIETKEDLLDIAFEKAIKPAMADELENLRNKPTTE